MSQKSDPNFATQKISETTGGRSVTDKFSDPLDARQHGGNEREKTRGTFRPGNFPGTNREKLPKRVPKKCGHVAQGRRFWRLILMRDDVWRRQKNAKIEPNSVTRAGRPEKPHTNREKASRKGSQTDVGSGSKRRGKNARRQFFEEARYQIGPKIEVFRANPRNPSGKKKKFPSCYLLIYYYLRLHYQPV